MLTPEKILKARLNTQRTQAQIAKLFGVCKHTWFRWEHGVYEVPKKHQPKMQAFIKRFGGEG